MRHFHQQRELYAAVKASAEGIGIHSIAKDMNIEVNIVVMADAPAALGIISRRGICKVRHLNTNSRWIQEKAAKKQVTYDKASGIISPADLMTKEFAASDIEKHMQKRGSSADGRAEVAARVAIDETSINHMGLLVHNEDVDHIEGTEYKKARMARYDGNVQDDEDVKFFALKKANGKMKMIVEDMIYQIGAGMHAGCSPMVGGTQPRASPTTIVCDVAGSGGFAGTRDLGVRGPPNEDNVVMTMEKAPTDSGSGKGEAKSWKKERTARIEDNF